MNPDYSRLNEDSSTPVQDIRANMHPRQNDFVVSAGSTSQVCPPTDDQLARDNSSYRTATKIGSRRSSSGGATDATDSPSSSKRSIPSGYFK
jgi:hypothetical protein